MPDIEVYRSQVGVGSLPASVVLNSSVLTAAPVNVAKLTGVDPTGAADSTQALVAALNTRAETTFDFGGPENKYLISSTNATGCTLNTNGTVTVPSTASLGVGMAVYDITTPGNLTTNGTSYATYITAIVDSTHVTVSPVPLGNASSQNLIFQFTVLRDGLQLVGRGALIYISYPQDGALNGAHFFTNGGSVSARGLKFLNLTPKTSYQRGLGSSNNGDLVRFGQQKTNGIWADTITIDGCEFWGAYASGFEAIYANRASVSGNSHCHANSGNGFGFTNILSTIYLDDASVYNSGDDMVIVICDTDVPNGTQNVTIGDGVVLEHGTAKGIGIDGAKNVSIGSVKISDTGAQGIRVFTDAGAAPPTHVKIKHPVLRAIGYHYGDNGSTYGSGALTQWAASTPYTVGQVRIYHGAIWQCITAHTSGASFGSLLPGKNANWNELITYVHSTPQASVQPILISANVSNLDIDTPSIDKCIGGGINVAGAPASNEVTGTSTLGTPLPPIQEIFTDGTSWTVTFATAHGLTAANTFVMYGFQPTGYNGTFTVASAPTTTTLTVTNATLPGTIGVFGTSGTAVTTVTLTGIPLSMPTTGSDHAVIYDPNANVATVFTYTSITSNTLNGCFANSPSATLSYAATPNASYANVPSYGVRIRNPAIKGCLGPAVQVAASGSTTAGGQVDYLQAYDVAVTGLDAKEVAGGIVIGNATETFLDDWKIRSYLYANSGTRRAIQYSNMRNLTVGGGLVTNDDGASVAIFTSGTNINVQGPPSSFRGAWAASTLYNPGDQVTNGGSLYQATVSFTSAGSFNAANWTQLGSYPGSLPWNFRTNQSNPITAGTTIAAGSNSVDVSTFAGSGVLNVASTTSFPTSGSLLVATGSGNRVVTYTGVSGGNSFTGCTCSAAGVMSTSGAVTSLLVAASWDSVGVAGASTTVVVPASPTIGDMVMVFRDALATTSAITVVPNNGQTIDQLTTISMLGAGSTSSEDLIVLQYCKTNLWKVVSAVGTDATQGLSVAGTLKTLGALLFSGTLAGHSVSKTATYATLSGDFWVRATANSWTLTFTQNSNQQLVLVTNEGAGVITLAASAGSYVGPATLPAATAGLFVSDGTNWRVIATYGVDAAVSLPLTGGTMSGTLAMNNNAVTGVSVEVYQSQGSDPAAPSSGNVDLYAKTLAARELPYWLSATGAANSFGPAPWAKFWWMVTPQSTTGIRTLGTGTNAGSSGTLSNPALTANGFFTQLATAATLSASSNVNSSSTVIVRRGTAGDAMGGYFYHARVYLPDASYNNTGATTGSRIWIGFVGASGNPWTADNGGSINLVAFRRVNVNGGAADTNWQFVNNDATANNNVVDTGLLFTAQHVYDLAIWCPLGSTTIYWQINDVTAATTASGNTAANIRVPAAGTGLEAALGILTIDATARNIQFHHMYVESDQG